MTFLKFKTAAGQDLYVPKDHLASVYGNDNLELATITLSNRMEYDVVGTATYIVQTIMNSEKNDNIQENKVEKSTLDR